MSNTATVSYKWAQRGTQPKIECMQRKRERLTLFGCVERETGKVVAQTAPKGNALSFKKFLRKVIEAYKGKRIIMVLDNVRYHHARKLKPFLEKHKDKLELLFLPPYSPDFNPMERVWGYMRKKITHNRACKSMEERKKAFWKMFSHFQNNSEQIKIICNINFSV